MLVHHQHMHSLRYSWKRLGLSECDTLYSWEVIDSVDTSDTLDVESRGKNLECT